MPPALPAVAQSACECRRPRRRGCLLRSSRNSFAAASISMQQFHQTRFIRKTFCQRLIERCQTASMLPGLCQTFLCPLDFSTTGKKAFARRTRRWTQMKNSYSVSALIGVFCGQVRIRLRLATMWSLWQNEFAVDSVFHNLSGHPEKGRRKKAELRSQKRNPVRLLAVFQIS